MLSYCPRDVLDEIWNLIESVSEGFLPTLKVVKILKELAESEPKARPNIKGKDGQTYLNKQQNYR